VIATIQTTVYLHRRSHVHHAGRKIRQQQAHFIA
jgi:hypothetical protein